MNTSIPMLSEEAILQRVVETGNKELMEEFKDQILENFAEGFQMAENKEAFVEEFVNHHNHRLYDTMVKTAKKWVKQGTHHARAATFLLQASLMERGNDKAWFSTYEKLRTTHPHLLVTHISTRSEKGIANHSDHTHLRLIK